MMEIHTGANMMTPRDTGWETDHEVSALHKELLATVETWDWEHCKAEQELCTVSV